MPKLRLLLLGLLLLCGTLLAGAQNMQERITRFHSDITIHRDATMSVVETIKVVAAGDQIKRGIYRDFPTVYHDRLGNRYAVGFDVTRVQRDGADEPHRVQRMANGYRVYIGSSDVFLSAGTYTYTLAYTTNRQLGFFADHDELYWNVTGNGWQFAIEQAEATVFLPTRLPPAKIKLEGYTGPQGSQARNYRAWVDNAGLVHFVTTRPLAQQEGLTIVVGFPKGIVTPPTRGQQFGYLIQDNIPLLIGLLGILAVLGYYLYAWAQVGRDPKPGVIVPRWEAPENLSPAAMRYVRRMGKFDMKTFTAAIISLAVHGCLRIVEKDDDYTLTREANPNTAGLQPEEAKLFTDIFSDGSTLVLTNTNHAVVQSSRTELQHQIQQRCEPAIFDTNSGYLVPGIILSVLLPLVIIIMQYSGGFSGDQGSLIGGAMFTGLAVLMFFVAALPKWRDIFTGSTISRIASCVSAVILTGFFSIFFIVGVMMLGNSVPIALVLVIALMAVINILFYHLMKAYTKRGRQLLDEIEGFRMYLSVAEKDRLNLLNPPEQTPELFERYLPYALALDVEQQWAEQFDDVLKRASIGDGQYQPVWYSGSHWMVARPGGFTQSLSGAFSGAIVAAAMPPGSSSGFSGGGGSGFSGGGGSGGSSGGGGGGGGGGGW